MIYVSSRSRERWFFSKPRFFGIIIPGIVQFIQQTDAYFGCTCLVHFNKRGLYLYVRALFLDIFKLPSGFL